MTPFLQFILILAIIILIAKAGGYISYRLGQPSVLGELVVGILLGPTLVNLLHLPFITSEHLQNEIHTLAELGVIFLMFLAGLELHVNDLLKSGRVSALSGFMGVIVPIALGTGISYLFLKDLQTSIFIGLILAATSVSISAQTLMELKVLRSKVGITLLGAAVFDDVLVILLLSIFSAITVTQSSGGWVSIAWIVLKMILFIGIATLLGFRFFPRLSQRVVGLPISQGLAAFVVVLILFYGWSAEVLGGMAAITGAFLCGLILARSPVKERIEGGMLVLAYGFFVPIFFVDIGLSTNLRTLIGPVFWLFIVIALIAIIGKILGAGLGALWGGLSRREALQIGIGMMSRGEVGLIVASVGITSGLIGQAEFSAVVGVVIVTTLLTPPLLRASFRSSTGKTPPGEAPVKPSITPSATGNSEGEP
jgi:Kef-type K+ transport system membrane component KefB